MSRASFDAVSLRRANQQVVLGAVALSAAGKTLSSSAFSSQASIAYTPDEIAQWFEAVRATVHADPAAAAVYMPAFEQSETARLRASEFAAKGITVASLDRWLAIKPLLFAQAGRSAV